MKNVLAPLKRFIQNKNTVTIICIVVGILTLVIGYNYRVNKAIDLVTIPYALKEIPRKTQITKDMIGHVKVPRSLVKNAKNIICFTRVFFFKVSAETPSKQVFNVIT